ncbi:DegT/DnrJ/EryC1/StrS family aminotransferase [Saccharopolyspora sp. NPDC050642]|uniref:DegT/DnrJ/EryC1/StrS family aminotransferase n=1 Tax=Saccharopolyspora sp. NPDC050642 TaxID=3157099 RepID=UPI0033CB66EE
MSELALFGGEPVIDSPAEELFRWPVFGTAEEEAVLEILREPDFFNDTVVPAFERDFAQWLGVEHALTESSGTHAVLGALFACGVGKGDEVIVPSLSYWASCVQIMSLKATPVFADVDRETLNISAEDVRRKITDNTRAIVVVHLLGYPVDMDAILDIARPRGIKVIEDASHAHGSRYKGRMVGALGDISAFSLCGKSISIGEGGIIATDDRGLWERAVAWGHNFRFNDLEVKDPELLQYAGLPLGGVTSRMHNLSGALGRVQLARYDERMAEIDRAMSYFWDLVEDVPGISAHRPPRESGSTMGGWYNPHAIYHADELSGLSAARYVEAVRAEGYQAWTRKCIKDPLHPHPLFHTADVYRDGVPTVIAHAARDTRLGADDLPNAMAARAFTVPPFRSFRPDVIERYAEIFRKVSRNHAELLADDRGDHAVVVDERGDG